ncbi:MAG: VWA domain-containing protein, partial [Verrucomicrobiales bacterium]|nr:VWA domain-containing protein [Verrucomicrobiales bacterium]
MTFADPVWFWGLTVIAPIILMQSHAIASKRDRSSAFVAEDLRNQLIHGTSRKARAARLTVLCFAYALIITAIARPQWGSEEEPSYSKGRTVMLAIDASRSMLAQDLTPSRLDRAKLAAYDLIEALPEDLIGLMAFSGSASVMVPITPDREALRESINQLDTYAVAKGGTNLAEAIKQANSTLKESEAESHALVLFTDGENLEGNAIEEATKASEDGTLIIAIGVGSEQGSVIPERTIRGRKQTFIRDENGELVKSKLDAKALEDIAKSAGGIFLRLDSKSLNSMIIQEALAQLDTQETEFRAQETPTERFVWPLSIGISLILGLLLSGLLKQSLMKPSKVATLVIILMALTGQYKQSHAGIISDSKGFYDAGEFDKAIKSYQSAITESKSTSQKAQLNLGLGASAFSVNNHELALDAFGSALLSEEKSVQATAHYNLGNTLFRKGEKLLSSSNEADQPETPPSKESIENVIKDWEGAIEHYESALGINLNNTNAKHNLDVVRKRLEELKQDEQDEHDDEHDD